jgi:predicted DNA-binding transcriptional regulator AlpA
MASSSCNVPDALVAPPAAASDRLVALPAVLEQLNESRSGFYAMIRAGQFPRPIKRGRASRWRQSEVDAFITKIAVTGRAHAAA